MRTNVRIGNDIKLLWEVLRGGYPVNFNNATDIKVSILQGGKYSCEDKTEISTFEVDSEQSNLLNIEIQADKITELGYLWVVLEYTIGDHGLVDGNRKITIDNLPVKIVGLSDEAGEVFEFEMTSDVVVGFDGKSAFDVWLMENPDKTLQDYFDWIQQPATDIAEEVSQAEALRVQAEALRVTAENIRLSNEVTRVANEQGRIDAENIRTSNEVDRVDAENIRLSNEQSRINAETLRDGAEQQRLLDEATRVSNEETRVTNEGERVTAEQDRVDAEIIREQQEADRQTNTAIAIANAEEATDNANDAADAANTAATTIDAKIATKAEQADLDQLAGDVSQIEVKDAAQSAKIKDIENVLSTANLGQSAQLSVSGVSPLSLPKNAANGGMSVKLEGLTEDVGGVITNFEPTGRVRSVGKNLFDKGKGLAKMIASAPNHLSLYDDNGVPCLKVYGFSITDLALPITVKANTQYTFKFTSKVLDTNNTRIGISYTDGTRDPNFLYPQSSFTTQAKTTAAGKTVSALFVTFSSGKGASLFRLDDFQIIEGTIDTPYEPYKETNLYLTAPELRSNGDVKDEIRKGTNGYELVQRINPANGTVLAEPVITPIDHAGVLNSAESGTVYHEPIVADAGIYSTKIDILQTEFPISEIEEIVKYESGINTYLDASKAVIAPDGLSFTHPDLVSGDLVLFTYAFDKESTNGLITATFYDSRYVIADTDNGKHYKWGVKSTNGVATIQLTEV